MIILPFALLLAQAPPVAPPRPALSASVRLEDWALFRSAAAAVLGWRVGIPASAFGPITFSEAAAKVDALGLAFIAGSSSQKISSEIPKKLDYKLAPGELEAVKERLRALNMRMPVYFADTLNPDVLKFARNLGVETIISNTEQLDVDKAGGRPPVISLRDQSGMAKLMQDMYSSGAKPAMILVETPTPAFLEALDRALHPVMARRVSEISKSAAIRTPDRLSPEERQKVEAALPRSAPAKPKKPRSLLVLDLNIAYGGHRSIPHANLALELMGKNTAS